MTRRIRVGVIGAGSWATAVHLPALAARDDVEIVVVARRDGDLARQIAARFGAAHAVTEWQAALAFGLDAVVVATPPNGHREQVKAALESGAHVMCEKPFAITAEDAWAMVRAEKSTGRRLIVSFGWNWTPLMQSARNLVERAPIGALEFLTVGIRIAGRGLLMEGRPYAGSAPDVPPRPETFLRPEISGGGQAPVTMSHVFGLVLYLARLEPAAVFARTWNGPMGVDVHDAMLVTFDGGAIGSVTGASSHQSRGETEWSIALIGRGGQVQVESPSHDLRFTAANGSVSHVRVEGDPFARATTGALDALISAAQGVPPGPEGAAELAARTVELVEASLRSAATGTEQHVPSPWRTG